MAYDTQKLKAEAEEKIEKYGLLFVEDVVAYMGISKPTFYDHFPKDSNDFNELKKQLKQNRIDRKVQMRKKWFDSTNPTLQMGLYKLLSSEEERKKLAMEYHDHTTDGDKIEGSPIIIESQGREPDVE